VPPPFVIPLSDEAIRVLGTPAPAMHSFSAAGTAAGYTT